MTFIPTRPGLLCVLVLIFFSPFAHGQDSDMDGISDADECEGTTSVLSMSDDFAASSSVNVGGEISVAASVPESGGTPGGSTFAAPVSTTLEFDRMGNDVVVEDCEFVITSSGRFNDGFRVIIDGTVVLNFNRAHFGGQAAFGPSGRFNTTGVMNTGGGWTPRTGEGNPVLTVASDGTIQLLVDTQGGGREDALDDMDPNAGTGDDQWVFNTAPLTVADCAQGIAINISESNVSGVGRRAALTIESSIVVCVDSDGDGTPDFLERCDDVTTTVSQLSGESACLAFDGSARVSLTGAPENEIYTATATNTNTGETFEVTQAAAPYNFIFNGLSAGDYEVDFTSASGECVPSQAIFTIAGELTDRPAKSTVAPILWLRSDNGVETAGTQVQEWVDQSPAGNNAVSDGSSVAYEQTGDVMNFNPSVQFDPTVDGLGRLVGDNPLGLVTGGEMDDFTMFLVPRITDPEGGNCGDDVFNFFDSENLFEIENFVPKNGCEAFVNNFTYGIFNGGERDFLNTENRTANIIGIDYTAPGGEANFNAYGNGSVSLVNQISPYRNPLVDAGNPYSLGQAMLGRTAGDNTAPVGIGEVIIFPSVLSQADRERVNTYLAIKYGIDLAHDYLDANGNVIWDTDGVRAPFSSNVAGLGRDDCSRFEQRQSASSTNNTILTVGNGEIATDNASNPNDVADDLSYLVWGNNGERSFFLGNSGSTNFSNRNARVYKVSEYIDGTPGDAYQDLDLAFDRVAGIFPEGADYTFALLIDRDGDGDFSNAEEITGGVTNADNEIVFEGVDLDHDDCFAIARPSCAIDIMSVIADCDNGNEFDLTVNLDYAYSINTPATPSQIEISVNGLTFLSDPLTTTTGSTSIDFTLVGNFARQDIVARIVNDDVCSDSESLSLVNCELACVANPSEISGVVYPDYDSNGLRDVGEGSAPGGIVNVYDCDNMLVGTTMVDLNGNYVITGLTPGEEYRVELLAPPGLDVSATYVDPDNPLTRSETNFVPAGSCNYNFGVVTTDFCSVEQLEYVTACFTRLSPAQNPGADVIVSFPATGATNSTERADYFLPPERPIDVGVGEVGPVSGLAFDRQRQLLYAGATVKSETQFPAGGGIGDIYVMDNSTNDGTTASVSTANRLVNLPTDCGVDVGTYVTDFNIPGALDDGVDDSVFGNVARQGIGDIDLSVDGDVLYAVNLFTRSLIILPLVDGVAQCGQVMQVAIPEPADCMGAGVMRPWAIGRQSGLPDMYVGAVCDASISNDADDLQAYVFRFNVATNTFETTPVLQFPLNYERETNFVFELDSEWLPWVNTLNDAAPNVDISFCCGSQYFITHPQPILADIDFDRGDMIIGFMDRFANQLSQIPDDSPKAFSPGDDFIIPCGDVLRAGLNADQSTWTIENDGVTNGVIAGRKEARDVSDRYGGANTRDAGPGGREFYWGDDYGVHFETSLGMVAAVPGQLLAVNAWDPIRNVEGSFAYGGVNFFNNDDGTWFGGFALYGPDQVGNFGKGAGFGDLEPVCGPFRVQIGNYVFIDEDEDGVQDPCDGPIEGVPVALYAPDGTLRATTTTNANGEYYFSGPSAANENWVMADDSLRVGDDVIIVFGLDPIGASVNSYDPATDILTAGAGDYVLTLVNQENVMGSSDRADSDADTLAAAGLPWDGYPFIRDTLLYQQTDFTLDAGFIPLTLDLALIKTIDNPTTPRMRGDVVEFTITVVNQGTKPVRTVEITDYFTNGLAFNLTLNDNITAVQTSGASPSVTSTFPVSWTSMSGNPTLLVNVPGTRGLASEDTLRVPIFMELVGTMDLANERFVNRAEISAVTDLQGMDVSDQDIDSTPDDDPDNDRGGRLNTGADNALDGDGTGAVDGIFAATDEDDEDPASVPIVDLAVTKGLNINSLGPDGRATFGETVEFFLTVTNQGSLPVSSVELYDDVPCGYTAEDGNGNLLAANQTNWTGSDMAGLRTNINNTLAPGQAIQRSIFLTLIPPVMANCMAQGDTEPFTNTIEIASATLPDGTILELDFDSSYDENDDAEDGGGVVNGATDNVVTGDGTGVSGSNDPATDDDDQDVANVDVIDVALRKYQDETQAQTQTIFSFGDVVKFQIAMFSQGNVAVDSFDVIDYFPPGLEYEAAANDPLGWTYDPVSRTARIADVSANGLLFGDSVRVCISARVNATSLDPADYVNRAEITRFYIDPEQDGPLSGFLNLQPGYLMQDADSSQDDVPNNDNGGQVNTADDNNISGGGLPFNEDEDDSDPAQVNVVLPVTIGDTAFIDVDMDNLQSPGDLPIENVTVYITNADGTPVTEDIFGNTYMDTLRTNADGFYLFDSLPPGNYVVTFDFSTVDMPDLYEFTGANAGADDSLDSDAGPDGSAPPTGPLLGGDTILTVDAGIVCVIEADAAGPAVGETTVCEGEDYPLVNLDASIRPESLDAMWITRGDGSFNGSGRFSMATTYTPGPQDVADGGVFLVLRNNFPVFTTGCQPDIDSVFLTVNMAATIAMAGPDDDVCVDDQVMLTGSAATASGTTVPGSWTTDGGGTLNDAGDGTATYDALPAEAGMMVTFTYTSDDLNGCGTASDEVVITFIDAVETVTATADATNTNCVDEDQTFTGTAVTFSGMTAEGTWTQTGGAGTLTDGGAGDATATYTPADSDAGQTITFTYTSEDLGGCGTVMESVDVMIIDAVETVTATADATNTNCVDEDQTFTGTAVTFNGMTAEGTWTQTGGNGTLTDGGAGDATATYTPADSDAGQTITFTYTSEDLGGCGTVMESVDVTIVDAVETVTATADATNTNCVDEDQTFTGTAVTFNGMTAEGTWTQTGGNGTLTDGGAGDATATYTPADSDAGQTITFTYTSEDLGGCGTVMESVDVTIVDAVETVTATADATNTNCVDEDQTFTGTAVTFNGMTAEGTWTQTGGNGTLTDGGAGDATATYTPADSDAGQTITFTYTSEDLGGCGTVMESVDVTIVDAVETVTATADATNTNCVDEDQTFTGTAVTFNGATAEGTWTQTGGNGTLTDGGAGDATATYTPADSDAGQTITFTYTSEDLGGCGTVMESVDVTIVDAVETVTATADATNTNCIDEDQTFTGTAITFNGMTAEGTWTQTGGNGTLTDGGAGDATATYTPADSDAGQTITFTYTSEDLGGCGTVMESVDVTIVDAVEMVTATADATNTNCVDEDQTFTGTAVTFNGMTAEGTWTQTGGNGTLTDGGAGDATATYTPADSDAGQTITFTYTSEDLGGCGTVMESVDVTIVDAVETVTATADATNTNCVDEDQTFTGTAVTFNGMTAEGTWTQTGGNGTLTDSGVGDATATYTPANSDAGQTITFTYTSEDLGGCGTVMESVDITIVDAVETVTATADATNTNCVDEDQTFTGTAVTFNGMTAEGTWTQIGGNGTLTDGGAGDATATYTPADSDAGQTITFTYTSEDLGGCGTVMESVDVTIVDAVEMVTATADATNTNCVDEDQTFTGTAVTFNGMTAEGTWTQTGGNGTLTDGGAGDATATYTPADSDAGQTITFTYTSEDLGGCGTVMESVDVTIVDAVEMVTATADATNTNCVDEDQTFTGTAITFNGMTAEGTWTQTGGNGTLTDGGAGDATATYTPADSDAGQTITFTYTSEDLGGCGTVMESVDVTIVDAVETVTATADAANTNCVDEDQTFTGTAVTFNGMTAEGTWTQTGGAGTLTDGGAGDATATYTPADSDAGQTITFTYTSEDLGGCDTVMESVDVTIVDAVETVTATADATNTNCVDENQTFTGTAVTFNGMTAEGTWTQTGGNGTLTDGGAGDATATYTPADSDAGQTITFTYTSEDLGGCGTVMESIDVTINDAVATVMAGDDQAICGDGTVTLSGTITTFGGNSVTGNWSTTATGTLVDNGDNTATYTPAAADFGTTVAFTLSSTDLNGCGIVTDEVTVTINDLPTVTVMDETTCAEDPVTFTAMATATNGGTLAYQWQENSTGTFVDIFNETNATYEIATAPNNADGTQYRVIVTETANGISCSSMATATLTVNPLPPCVVVGPVLVGTGQMGVEYSGPSGNYTYQWSIIEGDATIVGDATMETVSVNFGNQDATVQLVITDAATGCDQMCQLTTGAANLSLGSTVFADLNNNGIQDTGESGIPNVIVELIDANTGNLLTTGADGALNTGDEAANGDVRTDANGFYLFDNLPPGDYIVRIPVVNFTSAGGNLLDSLNVSSNATTSGFVEIDPDMGDLDGDDNGLQPGGLGTEVNSAPVTLSVGDEPVNTGTETGTGNTQDDGTFDDSGNMTVDFGFFAPVVQVGDFVFVDLDNDGQQGPNEPGLGGVTVMIFNADGTPVMAEADGSSPYPNTVMTNADGSYVFEDLPPGDYFVTFDLSTADNADLYVYTTPNAGNDATDSDAVSTDDITATSGNTGFLSSGEEDLTLDAGVRCNLAVTVAEPFTICSTQPIDLNVGASVTPASLGGFWTTPDGSGDFLDADGNVLTAPFNFGTAAFYRPGSADGRRGFVTLVLTTNDPADLTPASSCTPVSAQVRIEVLNVDCGNFFWDGGN